jgi:hypothetical protein
MRGRQGREQTGGADRREPAVEILSRAPAKNSPQKFFPQTEKAGHVSMIGLYVGSPTRALALAGDALCRQ